MSKEIILIIKHGSLGDLIRASGIIKSIYEFHHNPTLIVLTSNIYKNLIKKNPYVDHVITDNRVPFYKFISTIKLFKELKSYNFDFIYDLQNSQRTYIYKKFFLRSYRWITTNREIHKISGIHGLSDMLKKNNIPNNNVINPNISWLISDVKKILQSKKIIGNYIILIPGSSKKHPEKRWPYYPELIKLFHKNKYNVVSILGPDEKDLAKKLPGKVLLNLNWGELAGVINKSSFIISNDTGPVHIASCLKKPGIILFGPTTSSTRTGLDNKNFKVISSNNLSELNVQKVYETFLKF